ncbi:MAG: alpha/beta fold hydrolase [Candidatus Omnitrophica bacterium]|nr:alpha/beta fold hydrolase [Candidatus Omnitrophota bacterium]
MNKTKAGLLAVMFFVASMPLVLAQNIHLQTRDGMSLAGSFDEVPDGKGTVILVHMLNHDRKSWADFSKFLNQNGWNTLSIDLRGHGESRGADQTVDWKNFSKEDFSKMIQDIDGAFQWLEQNAAQDAQKVILVGASIGANLSMAYAGENPKISGVVLLSPGMDYRGVKPKRSVMQFRDRPLLFVASSEDTFSMRSTDFLYQLAPTPKKELIKLNAKGHGTEMLAGEPDLKTKIVEFFAKSVS